jgi:uncharacterized membrane protein YqgA involved in biofilm formation
MPIGVMVNSAAILVGGFLGALLKNHLPHKIKDSLPNVFGLGAITMGIVLVIQLNSLVAVVLSLILGTIAGELLSLETHLHNSLKKLGNSMNNDNGDDNIVISMIILFCLSGTGIFGAMNSAIAGDHTILFAKAVLDFFTAMIFGTTAGMIIGFISIPQLIIGLVIFYSSSLILPLFNETMINDFKAVGGLITLAVGLKISNIKSYRVLNMIPSFVFVIPLSLWFGMIF